LIVGRKRLALGVEFLSFRASLGASDELGSGEWEEFAGFGGIEKVFSGEVATEVLMEVEEGDTRDGVSVGGRGDGGVFEEQLEAAVFQVGREHVFEDGERDARLVSETRNGTVAGIETEAGASGGGQRVMGAIVITHGIAVLTIGKRATEKFDPGMFVGRDGLAGELASDPVGFFG
jgi:hypothetical protein